MKLSEMRPCDSCNGPIAPLFYVVRISVAGFNAQATNEVLGLNQFFGGHALGLAEVFSPSPDPVKIGSDQFPELETRAFICSKCWLADISLAMVTESVNRITEEKRKRDEPQEEQKEAIL